MRQRPGEHKYDTLGCTQQKIQRLEEKVKMSNKMSPDQSSELSQIGPDSTCLNQLLQPKVQEYADWFRLGHMSLAGTGKQKLP